jgi:hypothetical protein
MAEIRALSNVTTPVKSKVAEIWIVDQDSVTIKLNIKEVYIFKKFFFQIIFVQKFLNKS